MTRQCCASRSSTRDVASPFRRLIATGYYDGPTEGFVECGTCGTVFAFRTLDWDGGQDVRIFALRELSAATMDSLVTRIGNETGDQPRWPVWVVPPPKERSPVASEGHESVREGRHLILAARDLTRTILVWASGDNASRDEETRVDWFKELGLPRSDS